MSANRARQHHPRTSPPQQQCSTHTTMGSATPLVRSRSLLCLCLLLLMSTLCDAVSVTAGTSGRSQSHSRRRSGGAGAQTLEEQSDSVPDQLALAGRTHTRRGSSHTVHHSRSKEANNKDYAYGQVELNLVRPDSEALYPSSLSTTSASVGSAIRVGSAPSAAAAGASMNHQDTITLEDSQSAAEYVANAIKLAYKQPQIQMQQPQIQMQQPQLQSQAQAAPKEPQATSEQPQRDEERERQLLELHMQKELQAQQQAQQAPAPVYEKEPVTRSYELYEQAEPSTQSQSQSQAQAQSGEIERQYRTKYYNYVPYPAPQLYRNLEAEAEEKVRVSASTEIPKSEIMKQIEKSVIKYMKELEAEGKILSTPQEQSMPPPLIKTYYKPASASISVSSTSPSSATVGSATALSSLSDEKRYSSSTVRPKYTAAPGQGRQQQSSSSLSSSSSSSSYHHHHPSGHHHQPQQQQHQGKAHQHLHSQSQSQSHSQSHSQSQSQLHPLSHAQAKPAQVQHFQSETETAYQAPDLPMDELSPNVEFIYKIKTRAPLQTATVKTVSKPYTLPLKNTEHFDHGAALKNIEEFDLSHVVAGSERERERERERDRETGEELLHHHQQQHQHQHQHTRATNGKPHKLYFNSEIYHDINSLPFKGGDKGRHDPEAERVIQEYRHKLKAATGDLHPDYKGYTGYFAEPDPESEREEREQAKLQLQLQLQLQSQEDGYPIVNPYPYLLKKEPLGASKYEDEHESWAEQPLRLVHTHGHPLGHSQSHAHAHAHAHGHAKSQHKGQQGQGQGQGGGINSSLEYDSYSPRFNNNPEGYGYQHTYKGSSGGGGGGSVPAGGGGKRGKRGGSGGNLQPNPGKKQLRTGGAASAGGDLEASLALRPPPKK